MAEPQEAAPLQWQRSVTGIVKAEVALGLEEIRTVLRAGLADLKASLGPQDCA